MTTGTCKTAAVLAGLVLAVSGCGVSAARDVALSSAAHSPSPGPGASNVGCGKQPPLHAWAEDLTDGGAVAWRTPLPTNANLYSQPAPPLAAGPVAIYAEDGSVFGLGLSDGRRLWRWRSGQVIYGLWRWQRLVVVLANQVGRRARLVGLDTATGAVRWVLGLPGGLYGIQAATADGGLAVVGERGVLEVVSLASGRIRWARPAAASAGIGAADGLVLFASDGRLRAYNDRTGRIEWTLSGMPAQAELQVLAGLAVVWSGAEGPGITTAVTAVRPGSGRVAWRFDPGMPVTVLSAGPAGLAFATYVPDRRLYLVGARSGRVRWRVTTAAATLSVPLVTGTSVVAEEGGVSGFPALRVASRSAATGRPQWDRPQADEVFGAVLRVGSDAIVAANPELVGPASLVVAYGLAAGQVAWQVRMPAFVGQAPVPAGGGLLVQPASLIQACALSAGRLPTTSPAI